MARSSLSPKCHAQQLLAQDRIEEEPEAQGDGEEVGDTDEQDLWGAAAAEIQRMVRAGGGRLRRRLIEAHESTEPPALERARSPHTPSSAQDDEPPPLVALHTLHTQAEEGEEASVVPARHEQGPAAAVVSNQESAGDTDGDECAQESEHIGPVSSVLTPSAAAAGQEMVGVAGGQHAADVGSGSSIDSLADLVLVPDTAVQDSAGADANAPANVEEDPLQMHVSQLLLDVQKLQDSAGVDRRPAASRTADPLEDAPPVSGVARLRHELARQGGGGAMEAVRPLADETASAQEGNKATEQNNEWVAERTVLKTGVPTREAAAEGKEKVMTGAHSAGKDTLALAAEVTDPDRAETNGMLQRIVELEQELSATQERLAEARSAATELESRYEAEVGKRGELEQELSSTQERLAETRSAATELESRYEAEVGTRGELESREAYQSRADLESSCVLDRCDMDACGQRDGETLQTQATKTGGAGSEPYDAIRKAARGGEAGRGSFEKIRTSIGDIRRCLCLNGGSLSSVASGSVTGGSR